RGAGIHPGAVPEPLHLELEDLGVDVHVPVNLVGLDQALEGCDIVAVFAHPGHCRITQMIVFDLLCHDGHRFEGWFGSAADFTAQKARGQLSCPSCGASQVERLPSASRFNLGASEPRAPKPAEVPDPRASAKPTPEMEGKDPFAIAQMLYSRMLDELLTRSEDVGKEFPSEARKLFTNKRPR